MKMISISYISKLLHSISHILFSLFVFLLLLCCFKTNCTNTENVDQTGISETGQETTDDTTSSNIGPSATTSISAKHISSSERLFGKDHLRKSAERRQQEYRRNLMKEHWHSWHHHKSKNAKKHQVSRSTQSVEATT